MKTRTLATRTRRTPQDFRVDLLHFLPNEKAVVGTIEKDTVFVGTVKIANSKTRSVLRRAWRGQSPVVKIYRTKLTIPTVEV